LLETVGIRVRIRHFRDVPLFTAAFSHKAVLLLDVDQPQAPFADRPTDIFGNN
jgi:hypothetical protein